MSSIISISEVMNLKHIEVKYLDENHELIHGRVRIRIQVVCSRAPAFHAAINAYEKERDVRDLSKNLELCV